MFRFLGLLAMLALGLLLLPHAPEMSAWFAATSLAQLTLLFAVAVSVLRLVVVWGTLGGFSRRQNLFLGSGLVILTLLVAMAIDAAGGTSTFALLVGLAGAALFWRLVLDMVADEVHFRAQHAGRRADPPAPFPLPGPGQPAKKRTASRRARR